MSRAPSMSGRGDAMSPGPSQAEYHKVDKPSQAQLQEIMGMLKVKTSMLALGACERTKKLARSYPREIIASGVLAELVAIVLDGAESPLGSGAMSALSTLALSPDGRQRICLLGGATPAIKLIAKADVSKPNTERAVVLIMNLAADQQNRKIIREAGGVEALVACMKVAPMDSMMEAVLGALHNVMLTDSKAKQRAVDAGIAEPIARVLAARLQEGNLINIRIHMLFTDLLRVPDISERIKAAAEQKGYKLPGMPGCGSSGMMNPSKLSSAPEKNAGRIQEGAKEGEDESGDEEEGSDSGGGSGSEGDAGENDENVVMHDDD